MKCNKAYEIRTRVIRVIVILLMSTQLFFTLTLRFHLKRESVKRKLIFQLGSYQGIWNSSSTHQIETGNNNIQNIMYTLCLPMKVYYIVF